MDGNKASSRLRIKIKATLVFDEKFYMHLIHSKQDLKIYKESFECNCIKH